MSVPWANNNNNQGQSQQQVSVNQQSSHQKKGGKANISTSGKVLPSHQGKVNIMPTIHLNEGFVRKTQIYLLVFTTGVLVGALFVLTFIAHP